jgi:hypothetical protein
LIVAIAIILTGIRIMTKWNRGKPRKISFDSLLCTPNGYCPRSITNLTIKFNIWKYFIIMTVIFSL